MNNHQAENEAVGAVATQSGIVPSASQLITLDPARYVTEVFKPFNDKFAILKAEADTITPDASTTAGMDIAVKYRAAFRDEVRIAGEKARAERKAPILQIGKLLDTKYAELKSAVEPYEGKFHDAIKAEEKRKEELKKAEAERDENIRLRIVAIRELPLTAICKTAAGVAEMIAALEADIPDESFGKLLDAATAARADVLVKLARVQAAAIASEAEAARIAAERAELAQLREAAAERARAAQAEADRIAAEQKAEADRLAALAAEQEAAALHEREAAAAKLKQDAEAQAEANRKAQAEIDRQLAELAEQKAEVQAERDAAAAKLAAEQAAAAEQERQRAAEAKRIADAEAVANAEAVAKQAAHTRETALAAARKSIATAAAANVSAHAAEVPASAAPEIDRTASFYGDAPATRAAPVDLFDQADVVDASFSESEADAGFITDLADAYGIAPTALLDRLEKLDFKAIRAELTIAA